VLPPDINRSQASFSIEQGGNHAPAIRFGLTAIKNVGLGAMEPIIVERSQGGDFKSVEDLCRRCDLRGINKRVIESLIKAGVLDSLGDRGTLLHNINSILSLAQREQRLRETGQSTMFDLWGETTPLPMPSLDLPAADISIKEKLAWERELMGVYLSEHPFSSFASRMVENTILCGQIDAELAGQSIIVAGMVASVNQLFTRDRRSFASVALEDIDGRVEVLVWPQVYGSTKELWQEGNILVVAGKVRLRDDRVQLNCDSVRRYQPEAITPEPDEAPVVAEETPAGTAPPESHRLVISITQTSDEDSDITRLQKLVGSLKDFPGSDEVTLCIKIEDRVDNLKLPSTGYCPELRQRLVELVGEDGLILEPLAP